MCPSFDDPAAMTPDQRRCEIAAILARGVLRLSTRARSSPVLGESEICPESSKSLPNCLDLMASLVNKGETMRGGRTWRWTWVKRSPR